MISARQSRHLALVLMSATALSGCITTSSRPSDASAPVIVAGQGVVLETRSNIAGSERAPRSFANKLPANEPAAANAEQTAASNTATESTPTPSRAPAQVLRIWIAPWEDSAGNLHGASHVFTEVVPRRWQLASATETATGAVLTPLQLEPRRVSSSEASRKP
ncbi:TraV family lipoprotein [Thiorhodovibrio frisius]|uniref:Type IV conjugative transfer system lipoprotein (TraV) n=1 Tax=Thiorhodovibrio frisius TaxID=631362 RepID=H8YVS5_9GAMM|nr:TraV family lipoprotein [Thiorhodovibrio frisius]EIC24015.1 Type IV conjugative transfer system lipoprotein (TraV) [Thiorhodovibrio frisius]WPL23087.1 conjugal transfer protein TraV [Thiorhodovibrio frisius]